MKTPILNHLALTVPRGLVSDTPERQRLLDFYETVFGWRAIDLMGIEGQRLVLHLHQLTHFLYLVGGDAPTTGSAGDHFGIEVYDRAALTTIVGPRQGLPGGARPNRRDRRHRLRGVRDDPDRTMPTSATSYR